MSTVHCEFTAIVVTKILSQVVRGLTQTQLSVFHNCWPNHSLWFKSKYRSDPKLAEAKGRLLKSTRVLTLRAGRIMETRLPQFLAAHSYGEWIFTPAPFSTRWMGIRKASATCLRKSARCLTVHIKEPGSICSTLPAPQEPCCPLPCSVEIHMHYHSLTQYDGIIPQDRGKEPILGRTARLFAFTWGKVWGSQAACSLWGVRLQLSRLLLSQLLQLLVQPESLGCLSLILLSLPTPVLVVRQGRAGTAWLGDRRMSLGCVGTLCSSRAHTVERDRHTVPLGGGGGRACRGIWCSSKEAGRTKVQGAAWGIPHRMQPEAYLGAVCQAPSPLQLGQPSFNLFRTLTQGFVWTSHGKNKTLNQHVAGAHE